MTYAPYSKIEDGLKRLEDKAYVSGSTVDFFRDILKAQYAIKNRLAGVLVIPSLPEDEIKIKMRKGEPLISWDHLPMQESYCKELFIEICQIMKRQDGCDREQIQRLIEAEANGTLSLATLIKKLFYHDSTYCRTLSEEVRVREDVVLFIALHVAKPFFETAAAALRSAVSDKLWLRNYCPVCGSGAQMAKLEKEAGKKILYCQLCGTEWRYMRIKCPYCCSEDQNKLTFKEEEKGPYRVDFCDQCGRYIKTLDERKGGHECGDFIPAVEDLATIYLDIVAEQEGYARSWFFPPAADERKATEESNTLH